MTSNGKDVTPTVPPQIPENIGKFILDPFDHALASFERRALAQGVPVNKMIELLLNHLASVVAMVEPPGARQELIKGLVGSFSMMVKQHVDARHTTPGGIVHPSAGV